MGGLREVRGEEGGRGGGVKVGGGHDQGSDRRTERAPWTRGLTSELGI